MEYKIEFDESNHQYKVNGKVKVSYSQIFSRVGVREHEDAPFRPVSGFFGKGASLENAQTFGKALHKIAELTILGKTFSYDSAIEPWVIGLNKFMDEYGKDIKVLEVEKVGYSPLYDYCGTWDIYGLYKDEPLILDWKTCVSINKKWNIQTAAYSQIKKEELKTRVEPHRWAVQIFENGFNAIKRKNEKQDFNNFLSVYNTYKLFK